MDQVPRLSTSDHRNQYIAAFARERKVVSATRETGEEARNAVQITGSHVSRGRDQRFPRGRRLRRETVGAGAKKNIWTPILARQSSRLLFFNRVTRAR